MKNVNDVKDVKNELSFDYSFLSRVNTDGVLEDRPLILGGVLGSLYYNPQIVSICEYNEFLKMAQEEDRFIKDGGSAFFDYGFVYVALKRMAGDIFTVLDASLESDRKGKAIKDLIRKAVGERIEWVADLAFFERCPNLESVTRDYRKNYRKYIEDMEKTNEQNDGVNSKA